MAPLAPNFSRSLKSATSGRFGGKTLEFGIFWLARKVGNDGINLYIGILGMKLNPHSLRVGPASFTGEKSLRQLSGDGLAIERICL